MQDLRLGELETITALVLEALAREDAADSTDAATLTFLLRQYLGTIDNPELIVYRIRPNRVRYMKEWALDYHEVPFEPAS